MIISGFEKAHYGIWEHENTKGQITIKASRHGDFLEFDKLDIVLQQKENNSDVELIDHPLQDRYEIVSLKSSKTADQNKDFFYSLTLKQFKMEFGMVLKFNGKNLKICKSTEAWNEELEPFGDSQNSNFCKI